MADYTRFVRLRCDIDRSAASNDGTRISRLGVRELLEGLDHAARFNHHQRRMAQILREYPRPGVALFALHGTHGLAGHLWLEAGDTLRAATLGRHGCVDLYLPDEPALSLRHLMVLVRRRHERTQLKVLDLVTPTGFQAECDGVLRGLEADGLVVFSAAGYSFIAVPTGSGTPWDVNAPDPWATLPPRVVAASKREARWLRRQSRPPHDGATFVGALEGPVEALPEQILEAGEAVAGRLTLEDDERHEDLRVGVAAIARGVVLGRYQRCTGATMLGDGKVSRVHAVLIEVDGKVHLIDAGSTNGTFAGERAVRCEPVVEAQTYLLGSTRMTWQRSH
jgi:hypothetical protein